MKKNPAERLGLPTSPHGDIVTQPWFHGVQWDLVEKCKVKPPFIPQLVFQIIELLLLFKIIFKINFRNTIPMFHILINILPKKRPA